ncbi:MAG: DUF4974 domain-containing protein [Muribaculaceae bacterium]|nr:DUF4974 domain-containing protein [Muribaculaceae bacterium]
MDKIDRLLEVIEHPDRYSDAEIDALMNDREVQDVYDLISKAKDCAHQPETPDVNAEWREFAKSEGIGRFSFGSFIRRNSAAVVIGVLATIAAVAAGISISVSQTKNNNENAILVSEKPAEINLDKTVGASEVKMHVKPVEIIVFKEETLGKILGDVADYYGASIEFKNEEAKDLRLHVKWDQGKTLAETIDMLNNFEHIDITLSDNNITVR